MRFLWRAMVGATLFLLLLVAGSSTASAQDGIRQYRAAIIQLFLWRYQALPLFRLNPISPGSVVRLANETEYLSPGHCYNNWQRSNPVGIEDTKQGVDISTGADLRIKGELLNKYLAELDAQAGVKLETSSSIAVSPLSIYSFKPDTAALRNIKPSVEECNAILRTLDGQKTGFVVAANVLHGQIRYRLGIRMSANLDASARANIKALIAKVFAIKEADITLSNDRAAFTVVASPDNKSLAIVAERLNLAELARITHFLDGKRGADLEIAVQEALTKGNLPEYEKVIIKIKGILGDEIAKNEQWAESIVSGEKMVKIDVLKSEYGKEADFRKVGNYAAAMEIIRK